MRRILVVRRHEYLDEGFSKRPFAVAGRQLDSTIAVKGLALDEKFHPVRIRGRIGPASELPLALGFNYASAAPLTTYCVRGELDDEETVHRLQSERGSEVVGVYADPVVSVFPAPYCGNAAVGTAANVARALGVATLRRAGLTGRGVRVAVVDTGVNGASVPVAGGWSPVPGYVPGSAPRDHGTMCAYDVRIGAPDARILDFALLQSRAGTWTAFLSDAIAGYAELLGLLDAEPGPLVVNNSWGMYDRSADDPIGSPGNYSANPDHPFNQIVGSLVAAGADVFFAAGNCGQQCPSMNCGAGDVGPGASIHGANSHPDVVTVAAVTVTDRRLGYSSQGPGGLYRRKPDLAAFSQFVGSGVYPAREGGDNGTSAASPVAAGVAAALRQRLSPSRLSPAQLKGVLQRTARDLGGSGWDFDFGYGVLNARAAAAALGLRRRVRRTAPRGRGRARLAKKRAQER
jgi:subtilisin family serine protease